MTTEPILRAASGLRRMIQWAGGDLADVDDLVIVVPRRIFDYYFVRTTWKAKRPSLDAIPDTMRFNGILWQRGVE